MANWDVTTANSSLEFDTTLYNSGCCSKIDDNHILLFWEGADSDGFSQVFTVSTSTWAVTTANSSLEFDTTRGGDPACFKVDTNHFINFWIGTDNDGFAQIFTVNTTSWAVTKEGTALEFDTDTNNKNSCFQIDATHFINFWGGNSADGFVQTFVVNTTTWAVTTAGSVFEFDTDRNTYNDCYQIDSNHFINFWQSTDDDGFAQVFTVNTTTWAVTKEGTALEIDTQNNYFNSCYKVDTNHFILYWTGGSGLTGYAQVFTVNTSTWAVTTTGSALQFDTATVLGGNSCCQIDDNHFINFWGGSGEDGFVQSFTVNTSTWAVTTSAGRLEFDTTNGQLHTCCQVDTSHFINFWSGVDSDGFVQVFGVELAASGPANLKSYNTNLKANIKSINTNLIANVKSLNTNT